MHTYTQDELYERACEYRRDAVIEAGESEKERIANLVDDFLGDIDSEDAIIEIIANNQDAYDAVMDICAVGVPDTLIGRMPMDTIISLARASVNLINVIKGHAPGYIK